MATHHLERFREYDKLGGVHELVFMMGDNNRYTGVGSKLFFSVRNWIHARIEDEKRSLAYVFATIREILDVLHEVAEYRVSYHSPGRPPLHWESPPRL